MGLRAWRAIPEHILLRLGLELLATLFGIVFFADMLGSAPCGTSVVIGAITDNGSNSYLLDKLITTKFPAFL
eukprot:2030639-Amphidinium_carterae.1